MEAVGKDDKYVFLPFSVHVQYIGTAFNVAQNLARGSITRISVTINPGVNLLSRYAVLKLILYDKRQQRCKTNSLPNTVETN